MLFKLSVRSNTRIEYIDITSKIEEKLRESKIKNGLFCIFCPHTTGAITINENADPSVLTDLSYKLKSLIPKNDNYSHIEGNSDSHLKCSLNGASELIIVENQKLLLGTWQGIYFCEFDGPRTRNFYIKIIEG